MIFFLIMVWMGEKSAVTKSNNASASLFYGFMFYKLGLSFDCNEICTSNYILKWLPEV